jgi:hypothetical protein
VQIANMERERTNPILLSKNKETGMTAMAPEHEPENQADPDLPEKHRKEVPEADLVKGHGPDDHGRALGSDVAAGADQQWDEQGKGDHRLEGRARSN